MDFVIHINLPFESLYLLKRFKHTKCHRDRESDFVLDYVVIIKCSVYFPLL